MFNSICFLYEEGHVGHEVSMLNRKKNNFGKKKKKNYVKLSDRGRFSQTATYMEFELMPRYISGTNSHQVTYNCTWR